MTRRHARASLVAAAVALSVGVVLSGCASTVAGVASGPGGTSAATAVAPITPITPPQSSPSPQQPDTSAAVAPPESPAGGGQTSAPADTTAAAPAVQADLSWLKPGARVTYESGQVSSAADRTTWNEDPAGSLYDPKTGKRYSSDRGTAPASQAAQGVAHFDVASTAESGAVLVREQWLFDGGTNNWSLIGAEVKGESNGKPGEVWIHPQVLAQLQGTGTAEDQVMVGPWDFNGQQVQSQIFVNNNINNYYFYAYDLATGLMLRGDTSVVYEGSPSPSDPNATNTRSSFEFKGVRQRGVPLGAALPAWAGQGATVSYAGQYALMDPSTGQPMQPGMPFTDQVTFTPGGANWGRWERSRQMSQGAEPGSGVITSASTYAMDPTALAGMQQGAVLDTDPVTGEKWTVQTVADGKVVIAVELSGYQFLGEYEVSTGRLLQSQLATSLNFIQTQLQG